VKPAASINAVPDQQDRLIAWFAALAIAIHILEASFPSPVPGIKPGLANAVTLIVLLRHGLRAAIWVGALRVLVGSLLVGSLMTPTFWLSASGATLSILVLCLGAAWNRALPAARLSAIGLSVLAALAHMSGQFFVAYRLFIPHPGLLRLLPLLLGAALLFGTVTGWIASRILARLPPLATSAVGDEAPR